MTFTVRDDKKKENKPKVVVYLKGGKFQRFRSLSEDIINNSTKKELDLNKIIRPPSEP